MFDEVFVTAATYQVDETMHRLSSECFNFSYVVVVVLNSDLLGSLPGRVAVQIIVGRKHERSLSERHGGRRQITGLGAKKERSQYLVCCRVQSLGTHGWNMVHRNIRPDN